MFKIKAHNLNTAINTKYTSEIEAVKAFNHLVSQHYSVTLYKVFSDSCTIIKSYNYFENTNRASRLSARYKPQMGTHSNPVIELLVRNNKKHSRCRSVEWDLSKL